MIKRFNAPTAWAIGLGFLLASEAVLAYQGKPLLSDAIWSCEGEFPGVAAGIGFLMGHLLWPPGAFMLWLERNRAAK